MRSIRSCPLPENALLQAYRRDGTYTDCYATDLAGTVSHARYVTAFYTTAVFRLERLILRWAASRPSTDEEAAALAAGTADSFAAWHVEQRSADQLLLCDFNGRTRSWLMVAPLEDPAGHRTRLYFGSAVVPITDRRSGAARMERGFDALIRFHRIYSVVLLHAARARLESGRA